MNTHSEETISPLIGWKIARWFGLALLAGFVLLIVLATVDRKRVAALESFEENTAVGDTHYVPAVSKNELTRPITVISGQSFFATTGEKIEIRDSKMRRLSRDSGSQISLYQVVDRRSADEEKRDEKVRAEDRFLKIGTNEYLQVNPNAPKRE